MAQSFVLAYTLVFEKWRRFFLNSKGPRSNACKRNFPVAALRSDPIFACEFLVRFAFFNDNLKWTQRHNTCIFRA